MTPFDDFIYLVNHVLLGEEPTFEDFILLIGTLVAFIAFILWCCFPIQPKSVQGINADGTTNTIGAFGLGVGVGLGFSVAGNGVGGNGVTSAATTSSNGSANAAGGANSNCYSKSGPMYFHHDYYKSGHHCCT